MNFVWDCRFFSYFFFTSLPVGVINFYMTLRLCNPKRTCSSQAKLSYISSATTGMRTSYLALGFLITVKPPTGLAEAGSTRL